jgi:aldehyde:ferredoxin oxidoreductase
VAFWGRILDIDLSSGTYASTSAANEMEWKYLGGRGLNVKLLVDDIAVGTDPLGPGNTLTFASGLLTGTAAPSSSRLHINALSPLTGILGSSNAGGGFGVGLRSCGIQQLVVRGRAPAPVLLYLDGGSVEIRSAQCLWGMDTWETQDRLKESLGSDALKIMAIGPGGENGCLFGCIMTGRDHAAGRTGMGTVMGSKNLKAVVINPASREVVEFSGRSSAKEAIRQYIRQIKNSPDYVGMTTHGGAGYVEWADERGILATRNFRENRFEDAQRIDGKQLEEKIVRRRGCQRCPVQCKAELELDEPRFEGLNAMRPEFEPMLALGAKCGLSDLNTLVYLDNLCSRLGIDNISAGSVIAFAMDLYDRGIIGPAETGGLELCWGNGEVMETLIRQIAAGTGFGAILAKGARRAARIIGRGAERFAAHVKGLEMAGYHPRNAMGTALGYSIASRGADFNDVYAALEHKWLPEKAVQVFGEPEAVDPRSIRGKAAMVRRSMIVGVVLDSLGLCKVPALCLIAAFDLEAEAALTSGLTGRPISAVELFNAGERIVNLERLFNLKHGAGWQDDRLPDMFFERDYNSGNEPSKPAEWMEPMVREFYGLMGWDEKGCPTEQKLAELGIAARVRPAA